MTSAALDLDDLHREFGTGATRRTALDQVNLSFPRGQVHGLLGPNGAGKTTICRIVSTVLLPTSGSARVFGVDVVSDAAEVRRRIGIVFGGERGLYGRLSAAENLQFWCSMYGLKRKVIPGRVRELLDRLGLADRSHQRVETFSRGMKQRLHLARGMVADPPLLLLDEPTTGMDPVSAQDFRYLIEELRYEDKTILLTTHNMAEAESVCDSLTFVDHGKVIGVGAPSEARSWVPDATRIRVADLTGDSFHRLSESLSAINGVVLDNDQATGAAVLNLVVPAVSTPEVLATVVEQGHTSLTISPPALEDVYLHLLDQGTSGRRRGMDVS